MVLLALLGLHTRDGRRWEVSRAQLLNALALPETTVDDRLRTLVKEGKVQRVGRALYVPSPSLGMGLRQGGAMEETRYSIGSARLREWR